MLTAASPAFDLSRSSDRRHLLRAAVGFALVPPTEPELRLLHRWMDSWRGVGDVVTGMNRQGYWLHLSNIDAGTWRATFSRESMTSADGFGAGDTPWRAVQRAAWAALGSARERRRSSRSMKLFTSAVR
jgi:hypothetical protein